MSQKANYFKIGVFVIGAVVLGTTAVIWFGAGTVLRPTVAIETYLDESVDGLEVGSPVKYRGVQIGRIEDIDMISNVYLEELEEGQAFRHGRYVYIQASIRPRAFSRAPDVDVEEALITAIANGLRVRMASTGATGLSSYLEADYMDGAAAPPLAIEWKPNNIYVPSATSTATRLTEFVEDLTQGFEGVDIGQVAGDVQRLIASTATVVEAAGLPELTRDFRAVLADARTQIAAARIDEVSERVNNLLVHLDQSVTDADVPGLRQQAARVFEEFGTSASQINQALTTLNQAAVQMQETTTRLARTVTLVDEFVRARDGEMTATLRDLRRTIDHLAEFTGEARRNPSGLLFTNPPPRANPGDR